MYKVTDKRISFKGMNSLNKKEAWDLIRTIPEKTKRKWNLKKSWLNTKFYKYNPPNNGLEKQCSLKNEIEIPYFRNIFAIKDCRLSLKTEPVAYFSNEFSIICCETIPKLRKNISCSWEEDLKPYLDGNSNLELDCYGYGYPLSFMITDDSSILDLRIKSPALEILKQYCNDIAKIIYCINKQEYKHTQLIAEIAFSEGFDGIVNKQEYEHTQLIAEIAFNEGFDGIVYDSVRGPRDIKLNGHNLVMFNKDKVTR